MITSCLLPPSVLRSSLCGLLFLRVLAGREDFSTAWPGVGLYQLRQAFFLPPTMVHGRARPAPVAKCASSEACPTRRRRSVSFGGRRRGQSRSGRARARRRNTAHVACRAGRAARQDGAERVGVKGVAVARPPRRRRRPA